MTARLKYSDDQPRDDSGRFGSGGGGGGSSTSSPSSPAQAHPAGSGLAETAAWLKTASASEVISAVAASPKTKEAISFALQSLVSHATGLDQSTWKLNEDIIDHSVHHVSEIALITGLQAKELLQTTIGKLRELRKAVTGRRAMAADEEKDQVLAVLDFLQEALEKYDPQEKTVDGSKAMKSTRAYSILTIKAVNDERRVFTGTATTPTPDRVGDIVEPLGVKFNNPMPLLHQHDSRNPVGKVWFKKPTKDGIEFEAHLPDIKEPGPLKDRVDTAWGEVKYDLVRAVSIGFREIEFSRLDDGGLRYIECEVLELSLVTIPANADATIDSIKSIDAELLAASGRKQDGKDKATSAGVTARKTTTVVKAQEGKRAMAKKTIAEQISAFEATRQAKAARMGEIMDVSAEKGETLDEAQKQEYDGLDTEVKSLDEHLVRLRAHEKTNAAAAVEVNGKGVEEASKSRAGVRVEVKSAVPKGIGFARYVIAKYISAHEMMKGNLCPAADIAKDRWPDMPELQVALKAAVTAGSSTTMSTLVEPQILATEFIEYLWHRTILGRIPGLRRVPFNVKVQRGLTVASVNWVGEGKPKPLGRGTLDTVTLGYTKIAGIVPLTDELVRFASPAVESMVRDQLASGIVQLMDHDFIDPEKALVANVSPASITNGVTGVSATGTAYANVAADVGTALGNFDAARIDTSDLVVVMNSRQARAMSLMLNSLGQKLFPDLTITGGTFLGYPVVVSGNVDYTEDSPAEGDSIFFIKPSDILLADDGGVDIAISREASVQMSDAPDDPASASTVLISAFQHNLVLIRAERYVNWLKARDAAVQYIKAAKYA